MVMVKQPFFSGWASGSIFKTITCRAMFNNKFCMHRFRHTQNLRSPAQIWVQERFARKARLGINFIRISNRRSARLNLNWLGISTLGVTSMITFVPTKIPGLLTPEGD